MLPLKVHMTGLSHLTLSLQNMYQTYLQCKDQSRVVTIRYQTLHRAKPKQVFNTRFYPFSMHMSGEDQP